MHNSTEHKEQNRTTQGTICAKYKMGGASAGSHFLKQVLFCQKDFKMQKLFILNEPFSGSYVLSARL